MGSLNQVIEVNACVNTCTHVPALLLVVCCVCVVCACMRACVHVYVSYVFVSSARITPLASHAMNILVWSSLNSNKKR